MSLNHVGREGVVFSALCSANLLPGPFQGRDSIGRSTAPITFSTVTVCTPNARTQPAVSGSFFLIMVMSILQQSQKTPYRTPRGPTRPVALAAVSNVSQRIGSLLAALYPQGVLVDRRREKRFPYPHLVYLTPLAEDGISPGGENIVVSGKQLSENGLGFFHQQPLPYRRMIASLDQGRGQWLGLIIDLNWCRFTKFGWYESGGRLLEVVTSPLNVATTYTAPQLNLLRTPA